MGAVNRFFEDVRNEFVAVVEGQSQQLEAMGQQAFSIFTVTVSTSLLDAKSNRV